MHKYQHAHTPKKPWRFSCHLAKSYEISPSRKVERGKNVGNLVWCLSKLSMHLHALVILKSSNLKIECENLTTLLPWLAYPEEIHRVQEFVGRVSDAGIKSFLENCCGKITSREESVKSVTLFYSFNAHQRPSEKATYTDWLSRHLELAEIAVQSALNGCGNHPTYIRIWHVLYKIRQFINLIAENVWIVEVVWMCRCCRICLGPGESYEILAPKIYAREWHNPV